MRQDIRNDLMNKIISRQASPDDIKRFTHYIESLSTEEYSQLLNEYENIASQYSFDDDPDMAIWEEIQDRIRKPTSRPRPKLWIAVAASVLLISSFMLYMNRASIFKNQENQTLSAQVTTQTDEVTPGVNRALLKLHDGSVLDLSDMPGTALHSGLVINTKNGSLSYQIQDAEKITKLNSYNILETPRGGQYKLLLPDGTSVWLNSSTTIRFPVEFAGMERRIELSGEAYFEVAPNKAKPFIVVTPEEEVEVLGTHFNVSAYPDELSRTTLVEGKVKVSLQEAKGRGASSVILLPGQQGIVTNNGINLQSVTIEDAVAWKNGNFMFNDEEISSVMRKIARWYDVEIVYADPVHQIKIWGSLSRFKDISEVLQVIELTKLVKFKVEGRRVYVMKN